MLYNLQIWRKLGFLLVLLSCLSLVMFPTVEGQAASLAEKVDISEIIDLTNMEVDSSYLNEIDYPSALEEAINSNTNDTDSPMQFNSGDLAVKQGDGCSSLHGNTGDGFIFPRCAAPGVTFALVAKMAPREKVLVYIINVKTQQKTALGSVQALSNGIVSAGISTKSVNANVNQQWQFSLEGTSSGGKVKLYGYTSLMGVGVFMYRLNHQGKISAISGLAVTGFTANETLNLLIQQHPWRKMRATPKANSSGGYTFIFYPSRIISERGDWIQSIQSSFNDLTISRLLTLK